ncbi:hypothetical protein [Flavobacterium hibisci]|uniref:hypothetical protein n=1 Tax=Flavobacterium hibisci TaxID=1914462 RepID=UPI001CC05346|nr:hypothetical protein [Flavobacterium hibisci]MBZ4041048.1 hypothetical protein [Flavobacterium hibisci]
MKVSLLTILAVFFCSCQEKENKKDTVYPSDPVSTNEITAEKKDQENNQNGDTIYMQNKNEKGFFSAEGVLDSIHQKIYVVFENENPGELNAKIITPSGKGNIRFSQIIFPDQTSDGPFGIDLKIPLKQKGNHVLIIGHSQMAENPYFGKFRVEVNY